jgi:hypothetical protein
VVNKEPINHIKNLNKPNSLFLEGNCDEVFEELIKDFDWKEDFDNFMKEAKEEFSKM